MTQCDLNLESHEYRPIHFVGLQDRPDVDNNANVK